MRSNDVLARAALSGQERLVIEVTAWLGGRYLGNVPIVSDSWQVSDTADVTVPGGVEFDVPNLPQWRPLAPTHPLAAYGQRYRVRVGFGDTLVTWGWYRANRSVPSGPTISASGKGLLHELERARFTRPLQTTSGQTRSQVMATLCRGIMPLHIAPSLPNPVVPVTTWDEDRLAAAWEVVESWPARMSVDDAGVIVVEPAWSDTRAGAPVGELVDGPGGLLVDLDAAGDPDEDAFNAYVVANVPEGEAAPVVAVWTMPDGPMRWGGPYGYHPGFFSSPLNPADPAKLLAIGERMTRRQVGRQGRWKFTALPDPRFEVGDVVRLRHRAQGVDTTVRVINLTLTRSGMTGEVSEVTP